MSYRCQPVLVVLLSAMGAGLVHAEKIRYAATKIAPPTQQWCDSVEELVLAKPTVDAPKRKVLVFSLHTGYKHLVTPHVNRVFKIIGDKSGAFETTVHYDIDMLSAESLKEYDVLVLNNNCPRRGRRNLFIDELSRNKKKYGDLTDQQKEEKAAALEQAILDFVAEGKGLVGIHGAPTMLNNSQRFNEMIGAAFDTHPPNQEVTLRTVDESHPLVKAFVGKGPFIHRDEPYLFKGEYDTLNFRPLLSMDTENMTVGEGKEELARDLDRIVRYVAWIKPHGKGRVFYCSPSHFPESYVSASMLQFILDGVQYAAGDLKCDDSTP